MRLEIMERDEWTCRSCGATGEGVTLNVHHAYYESGRAPWEYPTESLVTWCEDCHGKIHQAQKAFALILARHDFDILNDKTPDIMEFFKGVYDAKFGGGPSFADNPSYNNGYALGLIEIDNQDARAITKVNALNKIGGAK